MPGVRRRRTIARARPNHCAGQIMDDEAMLLDPRARPDGPESEDVRCMNHMEVSEDGVHGAFAGRLQEIARIGPYAGFLFCYYRRSGRTGEPANPFP